MVHEGKVTQKDLYEDIELVRKDIGELKGIVHEIKLTKQDRVRANVVIPFILYLLSQTMIGVWWAADMSSSMQQVTTSLESAGKDRFYGRDGEALTRYVDTRFNTIDRNVESLERDIDNVNRRDKNLEDAVNNIRERVSKLESVR